GVARTSTERRSSLPHPRAAHTEQGSRAEGFPNIIPLPLALVSPKGSKTCSRPYEKIAKQSIPARAHDPTQTSRSRGCRVEQRCTSRHVPTAYFEANSLQWRLSHRPLDRPGASPFS